MAVQGEKVQGRVFEVQTEEHEITLRFYETAMYEVVRFEVERDDGKIVRGLTFRFCGRKEKLR